MNMHVLAPPIQSSEPRAWVEFLQRALNHEALTWPYATPDGLLHIALINVHRAMQGGAQRDAYDEAATDLLWSKIGNSAESMAVFVLLQLLAYAKPPAAKQILRRIVTAELIRGFSFDSHDLHTLALAAVGQYPIENDLLDYIRRSLATISDLRYLLTCFRIRARHDPNTAVDMLLSLLATASNSGETALVMRELKGFAGANGFRPLVAWYTRNEPLPSETQAIVHGAEPLLLTYVTGLSLHLDATADPFRPLLTAMVLARTRELSPHDWAEILSQASAAADDEIGPIIEFIWRRQLSIDRVPEVLGTEDYKHAEPRPDGSITILNASEKVYVLRSRALIATTLLVQLATSRRLRRPRALKPNLPVSYA